MEEQKSKLLMLADRMNVLNAEMHKALVEFLKKYNGFIRTDNHEYRDTMYAYIMTISGHAYETQECPILAVALFDNDVCILPDYTYDCENLEGLSNEEVLESEEWIPILGGEVLKNATLYNLCESIEEYVEQ